MADVELLPLPDWMECLGEISAADIRDYVRANVAHATAPLQAEIEALRAEVAKWKHVAVAQAELHGEFEARAERLAEALLEAVGELANIGDAISHDHPEARQPAFRKVRRPGPGEPQ